MTFLPRQSIHLFLCLLATIAAQKVKITIRRGSKCRFGRGGDLENGTFKTIEMDTSGDVDTCEDYARAKIPKCKGFQIEKKLCHLLKYPVFDIRKMQTDNKQKRNHFACGRVGDKPTRKPTPNPTDQPVVPTASPTDEAPVTSRPTKSPVTKAPVTSRPTKSPVTSRPTEWHGKVFYPKKNVQCDVKPKDGFTKDNDTISYEACDNKCGKNDLCMAYTWVLKNKISELGKCLTHNFWPNTLKKNKEGSYCVRVAKPTDAPVPATPKPTNKPTDKPTSMTCNIEVSLGFPFKDPDNAPYYGQHADWIEVIKIDHEDKKTCSAYYESYKKNPTWCKYKNSMKDGDSAYVDNYEDEYYTDDQLKGEKATRETIIIKKATEHVTQVEVYHWLFAENYYPALKTWNDHMMAAQLTITNLSHGTQKRIGDEFYHHPVKSNIPTHIKRGGKWVGNPDYTGNFKLEIVCNKFCRCEVQKRKNFGGFFE